MKNAKKVSKKGPAARMTVPVSEAEADRRLRPVLDSLYARNSKQALKHVHQALQKRPGWPAARALRACALMQSEHWADAEEEIADLRADLDAGRVPLDEDCARKLHMYYMEMRREDIAGEVYEQAWRAEPANFQLAEVAFCLYIRGNAFVPAQKLATKLHRLASAKTQKYGLWATAALWLGLTCKSREGQALDAGLDAQMLKLASAMLSKALVGSSTPSAEMARFALRVYKDAGEFEKARNVISNPRLVIDGAEMLHLRAELPTSDKRREADYRKLLSEHDADDWAHWLKFLACLQTAKDWHTHALDFVNSAIAVELISAKPKRGPFLAQMELLYRSEEMQRLAEVVVQYFARFGAKTVCAHDLRTYLNVLRETEWFATVFDDFAKVVEERGDTYHLTLSWLRMWYGLLQDSPETLYAQYSRHVFEKLDPTERQVGDDYLLLAAHRLLPEPCDPDADRCENIPATLQAVAILESGLAKSPYNFHIKLLLIRLYLEVGAIDRVAELWESLEVKHVLISTLAHLVLHPFFDSGHRDASQGLFESVEGLWRECDQEIPECTSKAFQIGSINAAVEFVLFRKRLERSAVLAECMVTEILHNIVMTGGEGIGVRRAFAIISTLPRFTTDSLRRSRTLIANDDFNCFRFWEIRQSPDDLVQRFDAVGEDEGISCAERREETIAADLSSLEALIRIAVNDFNSERNGGTPDESEAKLSNRLAEQLEMELPPATLLRVKIASNLIGVRQLLQHSALARSTPMAACDERIFEPTQVLKSAQTVVQLLLTEVHDIVGVGDDEEDCVTSCGDHSSEGMNGETRRVLFSPKQLQRCGRMVFDTLLVTCVTIVSFSPELVKGKRRAKKSAAKTGTEKYPSAVSTFECARQAILEYQQALISASSSIQTWIASCIEHDLDWTSSFFTEENQFSDLVSFLPETHPQLNMTGEIVEPGEDVGQADFCNTILANICSSHSKTCKTILDTLTTLLSRLTLADL